MSTANPHIDFSDDNMDPCNVGLWSQIKQSLRNLDLPTFIEQAQADTNAFVLDVRTPDEFKTGTILKATNMNYLSSHLADEIERLPRDKNYYVFCRTGRRSIRVCAIMENTGFKNVYNLDGGINAN